LSIPTVPSRCNDQDTTVFKSLLVCVFCRLGWRPTTQAHADHFRPIVDAFIHSIQYACTTARTRIRKAFANEKLEFVWIGIDACDPNVILSYGPNGSSTMCTMSMTILVPLFISAIW
jgi:hypothetical protein